MTSTVNSINVFEMRAVDLFGEYIEHLIAELNEFPENQFTQRLLRALVDPSLSLVSFWLLVRDCFWAAKLDKYPPTLDLFLRPTDEEFYMARHCGLTMNSGTTILTLAPGGLAPELEQVYRRKEKKRMRPVAMDPALKMKFSGRYDTYTCAAQRTAVRTCLLAKDNSTVIVNLPTGCGKTLVGHSVALFTQPQALTIMVVPTIALAIEQGQRVKDMLVQAKEKVVSNYAWHSGLSLEERNRIRTQIRSGQQKVLLVSPEAMLSSLLPELFRLAQRGKLGSLIIDEAHLIGSWGGGFRPDFQRIALLVSSLRQLAPQGLKIVLMSATFTEQNLHTIESLFCDVGQKAVVMNGAFLRQEMSTNKQLVVESDHLEQVLVKVLTMPKPMIVYTTSVEDCVRIAEYLSAKGVSRLETFNGDTTSKHREVLLKYWQDNDLDIMVATSAFGVGMDKGDVRSVLHASLPENIDRYYQEIGRAGRDGCAAHCEMVVYNEQINMARGLNQDAIISVDKGYPRWQSIWQKGSVVNSQAHTQQKLIDLRNQPSHVKKRSKGNASWNLMTVLLLQRAGIIKLAYPIPPESSVEDDQEQKIDWEAYANTVLVTVVNPYHLQEETWRENVEKQRQTEMKAQSNGFKILDEWLREKNGILCRRLYQFYRLKGEHPTVACGGCPACRAKVLQDKNLYEKKQQTSENFHDEQGGQLSSRLFELSRVEVGYRVAVHKQYDDSPMVDIPVYFAPSLPNLTEELVQIFIHLLRKQKVVALAAPSAVLELIKTQYAGGLGQFWVHLTREEWLSDCSVTAQYSKMIIDDHQQGEASQPDCSQVRTVYCARDDLRDPELLHRTWWESCDNAVSLMNFKNNIEVI